MKPCNTTLDLSLAAALAAALAGCSDATADTPSGAVANEPGFTSHAPEAKTSDPLAAIRAAQEREFIPLGEAAPNVVLLDIADEVSTLADHKGRTVLLNFWFVNCIACKIELPELEELWVEIRAERDDVDFLAVNVEDPVPPIEAYWTKSGFTIPVVRDPTARIAQAFGVFAFPVTYVVGPDGTVIYRAMGWEPKKLRKALASTATAAG